MNLHHTIIGARELPPLLFLHGFLGCGSDWRDMAEQLSSRYCSVLIDLPGHGRSCDGAWTHEYGMVETATALVTLIDELKLQRPLVIGYSMGGRVALLTALLIQEQLSGLVLEGASPGLQTEAERRERLTLDKQRAETMLTAGLERFVDDWYRAELFASLRAKPELLANLKQRRCRGSAKFLAAALRNLSVGRQPSLWDQLDELTLPVLLVAGELDRKFTGINRDLTGRLRAAQSQVITGAGHNTHLERPDSFLSVLSEFLDTVGRHRQR